jgi:hypothetical protein
MISTVMSDGPTGIIGKLNKIAKVRVCGVVYASSSMQRG